MRSKIRIGIIGCGQIAQQHLLNYAAIPDAEVVAIADSDAETLAATAAKFGIGETYSTLQELLDGASLDAVDVCLHNNYHADAAIRVMEAGLHCYSEKPMAGSYADALAMLDASHRTGNMLHIQLALIYSDETKAAKSLIDGGAIGDAYYARATGHRRRGRPYVDGYGKPSFVQHDIAAGGALFDMGVYHISEMLHLLGNPGVLRVSGRTFQKVELDELRAQAGRYSVEELGCGFVNFANGALLEIAEAWAIHLDSFEGSFIVGDKGGIRLRPFSLHQPHGDIDVSGGADLDAFTYRTRKLRSDDNNTDPLESSQTHWILALQGRTELLNTAELALNTMLISEGIYLSEELGREVTVDEIKEHSITRRLPV